MDGWVRAGKLASAGAGAVAGLLGGYDALLAALVTLTVLDTVAGVAAAAYERNISASAAYRGGLKKLGMFVAVALAVVLDGVVMPPVDDGAGVLRGMVCAFYCATEGLSVLENLARLGLPLPPKLAEVLAVFRKRGD